MDILVSIANEIVNPRKINIVKDAFLRKRSYKTIIKKAKKNNNACGCKSFATGKYELIKKKDASIPAQNPLTFHDWYPNKGRQDAIIISNKSCTYFTKKGSIPPI